MNQFSKILAFSLMLVTPLSVFAQSFVEGIHYSRIELAAESGTSVGIADSVVEYFSFSCPGCYAIEPSIKGLIKLQPNVNLRQVHMPYGGRQAKFSQRVFVLMTLLNAGEHKDAIFDRIHVAKNTFDSDAEVVGFFEDLGHERSKVEATLNSFTADTMLRKMNQEAIKNKIRSVPTITINDKYQVNVGTANTADGLVALLQYLNGQP